jgi:hypothetical protein
MSHRQKLQIIDAVACPHCGASIGELCRNARTGEPLPVIRGRYRGPTLNVCKARRKAFEEWRNNAEISA